MAKTFGPSALATPANAVTAARVAATPVLLGMIGRHGPAWRVLAFWTALAGSDTVDGVLARRHGTTRSGAYLDPLADKLLVLGAMWALVARRRFPPAPVAVMTAREVAMSAYRTSMARRGVSIPARPSGKRKTMVQSLAVGTALLPPARRVPWLADVLLWAATALTVTSGVQYWRDGREASARAM